MENTLAEVFPVGELLTDELEERGWTQAEFAEILGRPTQFVSEIVQGKKEITRESAAQISAAIGPSAEYWLKAQDRFFLSRQAQDPKTSAALAEVATRARLNEVAPMAILRKRGFITGSTAEEQAAELKALFKVDDLAQKPSWALAARRSNVDADLTSVQNAWIACARRVASTRPVTAGYDRAGLLRLAPSVTELASSAGSWSSLPVTFAEVGVRLVYLEAFSGSKISGATYYDESGPVIALSGLGRRLDKVAFTLLHEIAHLVREDVKPGQRPLVDENDRDVAGAEDQADELAGTWVVRDPIPSPPDRVSGAWIADVAAARSVDPIIILGVLQNSGRIPWRTTLAKDAASAAAGLEAWA